jgi:hypothetical protein
MHAGITAITELAVKSGLTNRLPPDNALVELESAIHRAIATTIE